MTDRDARRLGPVDHRLRAKLVRVLTTMREEGHPMMVTSGVRSLAEQILLYKQGRETPGPIVTRIDGVTTKSQHMLGRAADCCFLDADGKPTWEGPWERYGDVAEDEGLVWGGRWKRFHDRPHVELQKDLPEGTLRA